MRVFQGINGQAGQPAAIAQALRKIGVTSYSHCSSVNKYKYNSDHIVDLYQLQDPRYFKEYFKNLVDSYDIFHFHASSFFSYFRGQYPFLQDLILLKLLGKKIVFHFRGSEARIPSLAIKNNPYHYYDLKDEKIELLKFTRPEELQKDFINAIKSIADLVYVTDEEILSYVDEAKVIPRIVDFNPLTTVDRTENKKPLVIHAPSKRNVKGTDIVLEVINKLKKSGVNFDFQMIEGLEHDKAVQVYRNADIIIDQLRIGWYGVLSVEAMAMGKAVMCYIRDDLKKNLHGDPMLMTSPITLEKDLKKLIEDQSRRELLGSNAIRYFSSKHDSIKIAHELRQDYEMLLSQPSEKISEQDINSTISFFANQYCEYIRSSERPLRRLVNNIYRLNEMYKVLPLKVLITYFGRRYVSLR